MSKEYVVEIVEVRPVVIKPSPEEEKIVYAVTYYHPDVGFRTVWIDEDKFNEENLRKLIRADLETHLKVPRGRLRV